LLTSIPLESGLATRDFRGYRISGTFKNVENAQQKQAI